MNPPRPPATGRVSQQVIEGLRYVRKHEIFALIMLLTFCNSMFGMTFIHLMPSFAKEVLDGAHPPYQVDGVGDSHDE